MELIPEEMSFCSQEMSKLKIVGEDIESWGVNILVGDTIELDGTEMKQRIGHMILV